MRRPFSKIENSLEFLVEQPFALLFRRSVQPAEVGKRLKKELTSGEILTVRGRVAPNSFTVILSPDDAGPYLEHERALADHLATWLEETALSTGMTTLGSMQIGFQAEPRIRRGRFEIRSSVQETIPDRIQYEDPGSTEPFEIVDRRPVRTSGYIEVCSGPSTGAVFPIRKQIITIGRDLGNDLVLDHPQVSRFHAELESLSGVTVIRDRQSMNGTFVNGLHVYGSQTVASGDQVIFGTTICRFWNELL